MRFPDDGGADEVVAAIGEQILALLVKGWEAESLRQMSDAEVAPPATSGRKHAATADEAAEVASAGGVFAGAGHVCKVFRGIVRVSRVYRTATQMWLGRAVRLAWLAAGCWFGETKVWLFWAYVDGKHRILLWFGLVVGWVTCWLVGCRGFAA